jgi:hypothetical protein
MSQSLRTAGGNGGNGPARSTARRAAASSSRCPDERSISTFSTLPSALMLTVITNDPNSLRRRASSGKYWVPIFSMRWRHWSTYSA